MLPPAEIISEPYSARAVGSYIGGSREDKLLLLAELLLQGLYVLLDHTERYLWAFLRNCLGNLGSCIVSVRIGQHPVNNAVTGHCVFIYRHPYSVYGTKIKRSYAAWRHNFAVFSII